MKNKKHIKIHVKKSLILILLIIIISVLSCRKDNNESIIKSTTTSNLSESTHDISYNGFKNEALNQDIINYIKSTDVSLNFKELYYSSDRIETFSCYTETISSTQYAVCLFYKENKFINAKLINYSSPNIQSDNEFSYTDRSITEKIQALRNSDSNFEICGFVYEVSIYTPIGYKSGESTISHLTMQGLIPLRYIKPVETIEAARQSYIDYFVEKEERISDIPIYQWTDESLPSGGYHNKFRNIDAASQGITFQDIGYLWQYDEIIAVPLLDINGIEDIYILHLCYYRGDLIAELIIKNDFTANGEPIFTKANEIIAGKYDHGEYKALNENNYVKTVNTLLGDVTNKDTVKGIGFDGENYFIVYKQ